ncbi:MAG: hydroxyacylglutathione hydrolase [Gammaproteobacteria bacterium]|nr:hydroxyacylglutathione hydrolase [Gammaproteobacteria bacterium]
MPAEAIPAFQDNYLWLLSSRGKGVLVDPGDAGPVMDALESRQLELSAILITHHHADHIGGVAELRSAWPNVQVFGPEDSRIPADIRVSEGMTVSLEALGLGTFEVLEVPGHTRSHIAYYGGGDLYCGDTVFVCGCGRLFEGTPEQMHSSLSKIRCLPEETRVYCAHEYTLDNVEFALWVEPDNEDLKSYQAEAMTMRKAGTPTVPSTLGLEKKCNPFLRFDAPAVVAAAQSRMGRKDLAEYEVFGEIRRWKDTEFD